MTKSGFTFLQSKKAKSLLKLSNSGFTLIELLVAISILAILGTIGVTTLAGALANARDGKRMAEISMLGRSLEVARDTDTGVYTYDAMSLEKDFRNGLPNDSFSSSRGIQYCISLNTVTKVPPGKVASNWSGAECPSGYMPFNTAVSSGDEVGLDDGNVLSWTLCASMERSTLTFCVSSLQR